MARKGKVKINREQCKGCYLCIRSCPLKALEIDSELNTMGTHPSKTVSEGNPAYGKCIACGNCYEICPDVCIEVYELVD